MGAFYTKLALYKLDFNLESSTREDVEATAQKIGGIPPTATAKIAKIGPFGAGKSTNLESVASALEGKAEKLAGAGQGASTLTVNSTFHRLRFLTNPGEVQEEFQPVNVSVLDTPGSYFDDLVAARRSADDAVRNPAHQQERRTCYEDELETIVEWLVNSDVGCVEVTLPLSGLNTYWRWTTGTFEPKSLADYQMKVTKDLFVSATQRRMRVFCTLTKADEVDTGLKHNIAGIVYSRQIHNLREAVKQGTGIPIDQIFPCVNLRDAPPKFDPKLCCLLLDIAYTIMRNTRHASEGQPWPAPHSHLSDLPTPPVHLEPAADAEYIETSSVEASEDNNSTAATKTSSWENGSYRSG